MKYKDQVLILTNHISLPGGITNFYRIIKKRYDKTDIGIQFFYQGLNKKHDEITKTEYILKYVLDLMHFLIYLTQNKSIKIVQLNPSFIPVPLLRDSLYLLIAKLTGRKVICFFRGWDKGFEKKILNSALKKQLFRLIYGKIDLFYVLSEDFKLVLQSMRLTKSIRVTRTTFDGELFKSTKQKSDKFRFVYLGRLQEEKGIFIILEALNKLKIKNKNFLFSFIGWFVNENTQKKFNELVALFGLEAHIELKGYLQGKEKIEQLVNNEVFVFPSFSEGCPTAVIEALAAGLYVVSTDVGALKELIKDGINGSIIDKNNPHELTMALINCIEHKSEVEDTGRKNMKYAYENFEVGVIINEFHSEYKKLLGDPI